MKLFQEFEKHCERPTAAVRIQSVDCFLANFVVFGRAKKFPIKNFCLFLFLLVFFFFSENTNASSGCKKALVLSWPSLFQQSQRLPRESYA
jgi:hypothetical protein